MLPSRPVFRSYQPTNEELEGTVLPEGRTGEVVDHVQEELANDKEGVVVNELDFMNLAPRKPGIYYRKNLAYFSFDFHTFCE